MWMADLADHYLPEILASMLVLFLTAGFHFVWWMATATERLRRAERDIDGVANVVGTERAKARKKS